MRSVTIAAGRNAAQQQVRNNEKQVRGNEKRVRNDEQQEPALRRTRLGTAMAGSFHNPPPAAPRRRETRRVEAIDV